jgi:Uma2 family endonuclease
MEAAARLGTFTVEEYLSGEPRNEIRHEYIGGITYAMAGASEEHNTISLNLATALRSQLRGKPCRVFMVDMKVRLQIVREDIFYYPDIMIACDARDTDRYFKRYPKVLIEVLSADTERTDRGEKFMSYTGIETLEEYVLVAQDKLEVTIFRKSSQWQAEVVAQTQQELQLASVGLSIPLSVVYEGVNI